MRRLYEASPLRRAEIGERGPVHARMALPLQDSTGKAGEERVPSSSEAASMPPFGEETHESAAAAGSTRPAAATPPPMQQMERRSPSDGSISDAEEAVDSGRIPAEVFERDTSETKDWSMMSTDSVFGLQVAPSSDFTGFFLAHPELMDISTPPRTSTVDADAKDKVPVLAPPFENIPEFPETAMHMHGNYSFAFPNLIEDKRLSSKKIEQRPEVAAAAATHAAEAEAAPMTAEPGTKTSSKPEATPAKGAAKGGLFSCFPCC